MKSYQQATSVDFLAEGTLVVESLVLDTTLRGTYSEVHSHQVELHFHPKKEPDTAISPSILFQGLAEFEGQSTLGERVWIPQITINEARGGFNELAGNSDSIVFYDQENFEKSRKMRFHAYLPHTATTPQNPGLINHPDGRVMPFSNEEFSRSEIAWESALGRLALFENYTFHEFNENGLQSKLSIRSSVIRISVNRKKNESIKALFQRIFQGTRDDVALLSLLSKQRLDWFRSDLLSEEARASGPIARSYGFGWRGISENPQHAKLQAFLPIIPKELTSTLFNDLARSFRENEKKEVLRTAVYLVLTTFERGYTEAQLASIYSAIEAIVNGLGKKENNFLLRSGQFKSLSKKLRKKIREYIQDSDLQSSIIEKLSELRRNSAYKKVLLMLKDLDIDLRKIHEDPKDPSQKLKEIFQRRNQLTHAGIIDANKQHLYSIDLFELQILAIWLILRILDCPNDKINPLWLRNPGRN